MAVPKLGNDILGIIDIRQDESRPLDLDDAFLLESVADQISVGLRNARLYARSQKQAQQQLIVNAIRKQLQSAHRFRRDKNCWLDDLSELQTGTKIQIGWKTRR